MNEIKLSPHARKLLRQELRAHPMIHDLTSGGVDLNKATKSTLLDLASKCDIDVEALVKQAKFGPEAKKRSSGKGQNLPEGAKEISIEGHIPFEISISAMGQTKTYDAFLAYDWKQLFEEDGKGNLIPMSGEGRSTIKVLTTATDDDCEQTGRFGATAIDDGHGVYFDEEPAPIMLSDPKLSRLIPPGVFGALWDVIDKRAESDLKEKHQGLVGAE